LQILYNTNGSKNWECITSSKLKRRAKEDLKASTDANANALVARMVEALNAAMGISMVQCTNLMLKLEIHIISKVLTQKISLILNFSQTHIYN
jgi:hypothetical protein